LEIFQTKEAVDILQIFGYLLRNSRCAETASQKWFFLSKFSGNLELTPLQFCRVNEKKKDPLNFARKIFAAQSPNRAERSEYSAMVLDCKIGDGVINSRDGEEH